jgi:hypothetical protein
MSSANHNILYLNGFQCTTSVNTDVLLWKAFFANKFAPSSTTNPSSLTPPLRVRDRFPVLFKYVPRLVPAGVPGKQSLLAGVASA